MEVASSTGGPSQACCLWLPYELVMLLNESAILAQAIFVVRFRGFRV